MSDLVLAGAPFTRVTDPLTGLPVDGALIEVYLSGTSTPAVVYQDADGGVAHPWPVECDVDGCVVIYASPSNAYKWVITRPDGSEIRTIDPVGSTETAILTDILQIGGSAAIAANDAAYPSGATLDKILFGTATLEIDSANIVGTWALRGMLRSDAGVAVTVALVNLSDGSPDTPLVEIASSSTVGELVTSGAITFAAGGAAKTYGLKIKTASGLGQAWALALVRTA